MALYEVYKKMALYEVYKKWPYMKFKWPSMKCERHTTLRRF